MPKPPDSTQSDEYYDTFDSNTIATQRSVALCDINNFNFLITEIVPINQLFQNLL